MSARHGFTLIEMLAAVTIFLLGFMSVFTLFLGGVRFRQAAEATTRIGIAINNLSATLRLLTVDEAVAQAEPDTFLGDGDPRTAAEDARLFYPMPGMPGMMYRIVWSELLTPANLRPKDPVNSQPLPGGTLILSAQFAAIPSDSVSTNGMPEAEALRRLGARGASADDLVARGVIVQQQIIIYRP